MPGPYEEYGEEAQGVKPVSRGLRAGAWEGGGQLCPLSGMA